MALANSSKLPIIISGTGPAALLLAHALLNGPNAFPVRLYEKDSAIDHRAQGYRFRITNRGVASCRNSLMPDHYDLLRATSAANPSGGVRFLDAKSARGKPQSMFQQRKPSEEEPLSLDRTVMRQVLFKGLEKHTTFGKQIIGYQDIEPDQSNNTEDVSAEDSGIIVKFSDGTSERASLLVGADGALSQIRKQLSPDTVLLDCELAMICGKTFLTPVFTSQFQIPQDPAAEPEDLLTGMTFVSDPTSRQTPPFTMWDPVRFLDRSRAAQLDPDLARKLPQDYLYYAYALRSDEPEVTPAWRKMTGDQAAALTQRLASHWHPGLAAVMNEQDPTEALALSSVVVRAPLVDWRKDQDGSLVTLIGDAAHAMPPTGGVGATLAVTDAAVLADKLREHGICTKALREYEAEMRDYAEPAVKTSVENGKKFVGMRSMDELKPIDL